MLSPDSVFSGVQCGANSAGRNSMPSDTPYAHRRSSNELSWSSRRQEGADFHACAAALGAAPSAEQLRAANRTRESSLLRACHPDDKACSSGRSGDSSGAAPADLDDALSLVSRLDSAMDQALGSQRWAQTHALPQPQQQAARLEAGTPARPDDLLSPLSLPSTGTSQQAELPAEAGAAADSAEPSWGDLFSPADERPQRQDWVLAGAVQHAFGEEEGEEDLAPPAQWPAWDAQHAAPGSAAEHADSLPEDPWPGGELGPMAQHHQSEEDVAASPGDDSELEGMVWRPVNQSRHGSGAGGPRRGRAAGDALLAALAGGAGVDGPIELDTCMLYSPASTSGHTPDEAAGTPPAESRPRDNDEVTHRPGAKLW